MKNMYRTLLAAVLMIGSASLNAQNPQFNRVTVPEHRGHIPTWTSLNEQIDETGMKPSRSTTQTFMLTIAPQGDWKEIQIVGPNGFSQQYFKFMGDEYAADVEEGSYIVCISGNKIEEGSLYSCYLGYDVIVDQDIYLTPSIEEAQYKVQVEALDENGNPIYGQSDFEELDVWIQFAQSHGGFVHTVFSSGNGPIQINICCNELSDNFCISADHTIPVENQTTYFINHVHLGRLSDDLLLSNDPSELKTFLCYFNLKDEGVYHVDYIKYYMSEIDNNYHVGIFTRPGTKTYSKSNPIRLITNNKISDPSVFYNMGYSSSKPFVSVHGSSNYNPVGYNEILTSTGIYMNAENKWIIEPLIDAMPFVLNWKALDFFDPMTPTPLAHHINIGQPVYFGYRTPILYWQADNNNASSSIYGTDYLAGTMKFISDNGCIRKSDECVIMTIQANGNEIFNDSLWKFNDYFILPVNESCPISMEVTNDHLIDEGIVKANHTKIDFDLNRDDAMPPTMTVLRVLSEYGQENVYLPSYSNANITFAAGDFEPHDAGYYYDKMQYKGKPEVEVFYAIEGGEWMPLQYIEDETLFHVNFGNVFTINLSQLNPDAANHWIDLKFSLTDEAGNSQVQELRNVFFTGEQVSVSESIGPEHSVYPNPFNEEVHIRTTETINGEVHVNVYSILGEKVYDKTVNCNGESELVIEGSHLESGVYFYDIVAESGKIRGKIIKE